MHGIVDIHGSHEKMDAGMPEIPVSCIFRFLAFAGGDIGRWIVVISEFSYILFGRIVFYCFQCIFAAVFSRNFRTLQDMAEEVY